MSHTFLSPEHPSMRIHYNADFSGDVKIEIGGDHEEPNDWLDVPGAFLKEFIDHILQREEEPFDGWHELAIGPPEYECDHLVFTEDGFQYMRTWCNEVGFKNLGDSPVTHWRELPDAPRQDKSATAETEWVDMPKPNRTFEDLPGWAIDFQGRLEALEARTEQPKQIDAERVDECYKALQAIGRTVEHSCHTGDPSIEAIATLGQLLEDLETNK